MYIIWLILMALVIGYLAVPVSREIGYSYGRFGRWQDILVVVIGTLVFGVLIAGILSLIGFWAGGETGRLIMGFVGAVVTIVLLTVFSVKATADEEQDAKRFNTPGE